MKALEGIANIHVHSSIHRLNEAISSTGLILPETQLLEIDDKKSIRKSNRHRSASFIGNEYD